FIIAFILALIISLFNFFFKYLISFIYVNNTTVADNFAFIINIYCFMIFFDWGKHILNFILMGLNRHTVVNIISSLSHIFIFVPLGLLLTFSFKFGFAGFWYASFAHLILFTIIQLCYIKYLNIEKNVKKIAVHIN